MQQDIQAIHEKIQKESTFVDSLMTEISKVIVGQNYMIERLLIGLLSNGHVLLEGVPGLAKTMAVKTLSSAIQTKFQRIQFTPDLLPADLLGTQIYDQRDGGFSFMKKYELMFIVPANDNNENSAK